ncbi:unknown [Acidaminococcus intestini CAG:325]|nr:unknown [Acidaminococcus intestini CAG:325]
MLAVGIDDARLGRRVGIDEEAVFIGIIARAFQVAVTERRLDGFESRYSAAIALELTFAFFVGSLDGGANFFYGLRI